ncbi:phosphatase PAP2 family protein [Pararhizobium sp. DWP1-1-3]|uniref:phosphatase PAP2 family protein n=1 Tax=Pararhizobium sp. DWP1-1-3 TaxID=2804652 RepID=UPI003CF8F397
MIFLPVERFILIVIATLFSLDFTLIILKGVEIDFYGYASVAAIGLAMIALGQYYRTIRPDLRVSATVTATGLFIIFTLGGSIFNYMLLPVHFPTIDGVLAQIDTAIGFSWLETMIWLSGYPLLVGLFHIIYVSSLPQMIIVILILGFSGKTHSLYRFLLTGMIGVLVAMIFWFFFPSFGTAALYSLPPAVRDAMPLAVGPEYGAQLNRLALHGVSYLTPKDVLGLIAFPSFHTVMACMSVYFLRHSRVLFFISLAINSVMLPAIVVQGGHHLTDLFGGFVTFGLAYWLSGIVVGEANARQTMPATSS